MTVAKEVEKIVKEDKMGFLKDEYLKKLQAYYEEMRNLGLVKKQEYTLPQLDTVGISCQNKPA